MGRVACLVVALSGCGVLLSVDETGDVARRSRWHRRTPGTTLALQLEFRVHSFSVDSWDDALTPLVGTLSRRAGDRDRFDT